MTTPGNVGDHLTSRSRPPALRIVVFGGIGAGKSTVTGLFEAKGALVVEGDKIGHEILGPGKPAAAAVAERWPQVVDDGVIQRSRLASIVFNDQKALRDLEAITHPAIGAEIVSRSEQAGDMPVVVEVPLVAKWFGPEWWWVVVVADERTRLDRAVSRGSDRQDAADRMSSQPAEDVYREAADHVIVNDGDLLELSAEVDAIWDRLHEG